MPRRLALVLVLLAGCASTDEARLAEPGGYGSGDEVGYALARTDEGIRTVQLYRSGDEGSLPVVGLRSGQTLTLEFDLLADYGEPFSVYFYHADRRWQRDLLPTEYLQTFVSDDLRDYEPSLGTEVRYVHYTYEFPNQNIQFLRSGNYVLRVTEPGDEHAVLFERAFFISEQSAEVDFAVRSGPGSYFQPLARVNPPSGLDSPVYDYNVCFARNGRFEQVRCATEPTLIGGSLFEFLLPRPSAFGPEGPLYELDLSYLQAGPRIAAVDRQTSPYVVTLAPDFARFGGDLFEDALAGQTLVSTVVQDAASDPDIAGEYVEAQFAYVPQDERELAGPVILSGSFNDWVIDPAHELVWNPAEQRYEGSLLVKQGRHVYRYYADDPAERERIARTVNLGRPSLYTALVYLYDPAFNTDRLVSVSNVLGR